MLFVMLPYTLSCCMACNSLGDLRNRCLVNWSWSPAIAVNACLPTTDDSNMCTTPASSASSTSSSAGTMINNSWELSVNITFMANNRNDPHSHVYLHLPLILAIFIILHLSHLCNHYSRKLKQESHICCLT